MYSITYNNGAGNNFSSGRRASSIESEQGRNYVRLERYDLLLHWAKKSKVNAEIATQRFTNKIVTLQSLTLDAKDFEVLKGCKSLHLFNCTFDDNHLKIIPSVELKVTHLAALTARAMAFLKKE